MLPKRTKALVSRREGERRQTPGTCLYLFKMFIGVAFIFTFGFTVDIPVVTRLIWSSVRRTPTC